MNLSRRAVLAASGLATVAGSARADTPAPAVVVSTWDFGAAANAEAVRARIAGGSGLDMVEAGAKVPEADPTNHSVGLGGYPDRDGHVTLDSVVMDHAGNVGAVAALEDIVHAVSVARAVLEKTPHTMLVGAGARSFAVDQGFPLTNLLTPEAEAAWKEWLKTAQYAPRVNSENTDWRSQPGGPGNHDTIGILGIGPDGHMAGACTTSGMAFKMRGRVGDSPITGAGLYVDDEVGAATATGVGEDVVRICGSHSVVEAMRHGMSPTEACRSVVERLARLRGAAIKDHQVALLALSKTGVAGGWALQPGFTYAVTDAAGNTRIERAGSFFGA
ncbi:N(4)-(beta-N-acetylglucosaminyl)-L-asparaginase [Brevundimonas goettingensis]|uniref:N(4)-(Beta-N-acetylglucosaminyl)-L-asparaginase n=1 Tax=Brevundimonas goettingensis TaxID=2774190 RepID=A0A975C0K6_9CAUL|nr:N(4)-(beta-N-acetylglucosaminyl)-L-asparaginase [Brevundimonas goettingensis]QTC91531.1 N(4)-(beta-N-acetylglucosaminyl)-L-asparaginase [Brevundimonas goettingensis]